MNEKSVRETLAIFPSSGSSLSARWIERSGFRFSRTVTPLSLSLFPLSGPRIADRSRDLSERIGASCRLISNPALKSRDPLVPKSLRFRCASSHRWPHEVTTLLLFARARSRSSRIYVNSAGPRWRRVALRKLDKRKTTPMPATSWDIPDQTGRVFCRRQPVDSHSANGLGGRLGRDEKLGRRNESRSRPLARLGMFNYARGPRKVVIISDFIVR